ncbi:hypothetical protein [Paenibacillus xylaniclasticus]|uniref:hypothetical protein n=1 Tax=Paenibacillus xylaniclasticus TaxID=588083 RepID=UPI000FD97992|nr:MULTISPECIES: hypothetical protein [Paenibacillus]GFN30377.1 hypothetical protein PCURB6_06370 [Paenibacillus curdlanolyticus]
MPALLRRAGAFAFALLLLLFQTIGMALALTPEEQAIQQLLEKSLSVVEIDKEITRVQEQMNALEASLLAVSAQIEDKELQIKQQREEAGKVLRSYYMGERDWLLEALFSFHSMREWLQMLDYIDVIFERDRTMLLRYAEEAHLLREAYNQQTEERQKLEAVKTDLLLQRERVAKLEEELDTALAGRSDADRLRLMMNELTNYWNSAGMNEVRTYFEALSEAMKHLPEWVQENKDFLEINGFQYTLRVPEDALNQFLRDQNEMFNVFEFRFENDQVIASGSRSGMSIEVAGHYTIESEPSSIQFHVDELKFNELALPDTTRRELEQSFDLGFYPQQIVSFLRAKEVDVQDGELVVTLSVQF